MSGIKIIAEAGVNHNGSLAMALELIDLAAEAGADFVKFQTFKSEKVISRYASKAEYQKATTGEQDSQLEMVKKLELSPEDHMSLLKHCAKRGIGFMSTPFDLGSLDFLVGTLHVDTIKVASGELTNAPFLYAVGRTQRPIILSTGMATLGEVERALSLLALAYVNPTQEVHERSMTQAFVSPKGQAALKEKVSLLHCTTEYPAPFEEVNLRAMQTLSAAFGLTVGYSDHTPGIAVSLAAAALGACLIEKHFTLDKTLPGPDHQASMSPDELRGLVKGVREIELALGNGVKIPQRSEIKNIDIARRSIVAAERIQKEDVFTSHNLDFKRPGTGLSPFRYWELIGTKAKQDFQEDEVIF